MLLNSCLFFNATNDEEVTKEQADEVKKQITNKVEVGEPELVFTT